MRSKLAVVLGVLFVGALLGAPVGVANAPNQGAKDKVLLVENELVACADPQPGTKVEGNLGRTIEFTADEPIDFVTVKSGKDAAVVSSEFDTFSGTITLSKDVSNYVVWTCPAGEGEIEPSSE